jgi:type II secretory pathway component GspD/PulD (secretin)
MRLHVFPAALALAATLASSLASSGAASAAPPGISTKKLDLELRGADVKNVFRLLAEVSGRNVVLDTCVRGTVDLKLANTPVPLVFDALALKMGLLYDEQDGDVLVRCAGDGGADDARRLARVSVAVKAVSLPEVATQLAAAAKLDGVDYRAKARPNVNVTLENVRLSTAVSVLAETSGLRVMLSRGKIVVEDAG